MHARKEDDVVSRQEIVLLATAVQYCTNPCTPFQGRVLIELRADAQCPSLCKSNVTPPYTFGMNECVITVRESERRS